MDSRKSENKTVSIIETILLLLFALIFYMYALRIDFIEREVVAFSPLSICSENGKSVRETSSPEGFPLYHVPKEMKRIYICGTMETPIQMDLGINLFKINGDDENVVWNRIPSRSFTEGPFIFDVISTEKLVPGEYRADLSIGRIYKANVRFLIED